jgi:hypothetical protein
MHIGNAEFYLVGRRHRRMQGSSNFGGHTAGYRAERMTGSAPGLPMTLQSYGVFLSKAARTPANSLRYFARGP